MSILLAAVAVLVVVLGVLARTVDPVTSRNLARLAVAGAVLLALLLVIGVVAATR